MAWAKTPDSLKAAFETLLPADPRVERRKMFGLPCAFVNGNMFAGVHESSLILRLGEADRDAARREIGARDFAPMGRLMRAYVAVSEPTGEDLDVMRLWLARALAFAADLPAKAKKPRKKTP